MNNKIIELFKDKEIAILGFGKEGRSTYHFIRKYLKNQKLTIIDKNEKLLEDNEELSSDSNIKLILGNDYLKYLDKFDFIMKSPGISFKDIDLTINYKITSQLKLALEFYHDNIIGITGTKGKSTTTSLIYQILKDQKKDVYLLGNIGVPIFDYIDKINEDTIFVIEMSALQLEHVEYSPKYGIILNLFEEHLDHFVSKENYYSAKLNIFKYQSENDFAIYFQDNDVLNNYIDNNYLARKIKISLKNESDVYLKDNFIYSNLDDIKKIYDTNKIRKLQGKHNLIDIMFALTISELFNLDNKKTIRSISNFDNLAHRLELVGTYDDITYYDDAIATIPKATYYAIETLKNVDTLIFGGMDRGIDYSDFARYLARSNISNLLCMKDSGYKIGKMIENIGTKNNVLYVNNLEEAVKFAKCNTKKGKICLLSPAASSYNEFKNYEEKGQKYKDLIIGG